MPTTEAAARAIRGRTVYHKRPNPDNTQQLRRYIQIAFLCLNILLGIQFYLFVRQYETGLAATVSRPPGIEGWLPIAGLMNLKYLITTGQVPYVHPAGMFLILAFLTISLLVRKTFCSWLCPIGTISEWLWKYGRKTFRRNWLLPKWLDLTLRSLKYILLTLFLYAVGSMPADALAAFLASPYGIIADVKMLNFFRFLSVTGAVVIGVLAVSSIFVQNFWCRYLCPYGALMGFVSLFSPARIRRVPEKCIDCAKCAKACPSLLPVDTLVQIRSAECLGCLECVAVCPAEGALDLTVLRNPVGRRYTDGRVVAATIALVFFSFVGYAKYMGYWETDVSEDVYRRLIPNHWEYDHPR